MNPESYVANHVKGLPRSGIRDFFAVVSEMPQAISLGIGEPDFVTPWKIREAAIFALEKGKTSYTDNRGLLSLRKEISKYVSSFFGPEYDPASEILVTVGVSEAIDIALRAIVNPGDKSTSYMWHKLNNTHIAEGGSGAQMPCSGMPLPANQLILIGDWIDEGAEP